MEKDWEALARTFEACGVGGGGARQHSWMDTGTRGTTHVFAEGRLPGMRSSFPVPRAPPRMLGRGRLHSDAPVSMVTSARTLNRNMRSAMSLSRNAGMVLANQRVSQPPESRPM